MKDVKEALERAFLLAKAQGVVLKTVDFESLSKQSSTRDKFYVQLLSLDIKSTTLRSDEE